MFARPFRRDLPALCVSCELPWFLFCFRLCLPLCFEPYTTPCITRRATSSRGVPPYIARTFGAGFPMPLPICHTVVFLLQFRHLFPCACFLCIHFALLLFSVPRFVIHYSVPFSIRNPVHPPQFPGGLSPTQPPSNVVFQFVAPCVPSEFSFPFPVHLLWVPQCPSRSILRAFIVREIRLVLHAFPLCSAGVSSYLVPVLVSSCFPMNSLLVPRGSL